MQAAQWSRPTEGKVIAAKRTSDASLRLFSSGARSARAKLDVKTITSGLRPAWVYPCIDRYGHGPIGTARGQGGLRRLAARQARYAPFDPTARPARTRRLAVGGQCL